MGTKAATWQPAPDGYMLKHSGLVGKLVLRGSIPGLRRLVPPFNDASPWPGPVLGVQSVQVAGKPPFQVHTRGTAAQRRQRGNLVDVSLDASSQRPLRLHLYWRATASRQLDMEVLATTAIPFEHVEVLTCTRVPCTEVLVPIAGSASKWLDVRDGSPYGSKWLVVPRDREAARFSLDGRSPEFGEMAITAAFAHPVVLCRPADRAWSYVEMSHPDDCARIIVSRHRAGREVCFGLFGLDLEKGVIARGRVRAAYVGRDGDQEQAIELCTRFAAEPPRLSV